MRHLGMRFNLWLKGQESQDPRWNTIILSNFLVSTTSQVFDKYLYLLYNNNDIVIVYNLSTKT